MNRQRIVPGRRMGWNGASRPVMSKKNDNESDRGLGMDELIQFTTRLMAIDSFHAQAMQNHPSRVEIDALPFYARHKLTRLCLMLPRRPVELRFADDGRNLFGLATPASVYAVNAREQLALTPEQVAPYLRFVFESTTLGRDLRIAERAEELRWIEPQGSERERHEAEKAATAALVRPVRIMSSSPEGYVVSATALRGRTLVEATIHVAKSGEVEIDGTRTVAESVPVRIAFP